MDTFRSPPPARPNIVRQTVFLVVAGVAFLGFGALNGRAPSPSPPFLTPPSAPDVKGHTDVLLPPSHTAAAPAAPPPPVRRPPPPPPHLPFVPVYVNDALLFDYAGEAKSWSYYDATGPLQLKSRDSSMTQSTDGKCIRLSELPQGASTDASTDAPTQASDTAESDEDRVIYRSRRLQPGSSGGLVAHVSQLSLLYSQWSFWILDDAVASGVLRDDGCDWTVPSTQPRPFLWAPVCRGDPMKRITWQVFGGDAGPDAGPRASNIVLCLSDVDTWSPPRWVDGTNWTQTTSRAWTPPHLRFVPAKIRRATVNAAGEGAEWPGAGGGALHSVVGDVSLLQSLDGNCVWWKQSGTAVTQGGWTMRLDVDRSSDWHLMMTDYNRYFGDAGPILTVNCTNDIKSVMTADLLASQDSWFSLCGESLVSNTILWSIDASIGRVDAQAVLCLPNASEPVWIDGQHWGEMASMDWHSPDRTVVRPPFPPPPSIPPYPPSPPPPPSSPPPPSAPPPHCKTSGEPCHPMCCANLCCGGPFTWNSSGTVVHTPYCSKEHCGATPFPPPPPPPPSSPPPPSAPPPPRSPPPAPPFPPSPPSPPPSPPSLPPSSPPPPDAPPSSPPIT